MPFSYRVVAPAPVVSRRSTQENIWLWSAVFSRAAWAVLATSLVATGVVMWVVDGSHNDLAVKHDHADRHTLHNALSGVYFSVAGFVSKTDEFEPRTFPGRILNVFTSFAVFLFAACFTANLAAILIAGDPTTQPISSIASFATHHVPACVTEKLTDLQFMAANYPATAVTPVGGTIHSLLSQVASGECAGAVAPDAYLAYAMSPAADPTGAFCGLQFVGEPLSFGLFGIPFSPAIDQRALDSLAITTLSLLADGSYAAAKAAYFPDPSARAQCPAAAVDVTAAPGSRVPPLSLDRLSGVFLVQAMGVVASLVAWLVMRRARHHPAGFVPELLCSRRQLHTVRRVSAASAAAAWPAAADKAAADVEAEHRPERLLELATAAEAAAARLRAALAEADDRPHHVAAGGAGGAHHHTG